MKQKLDIYDTLFFLQFPGTWLLPQYGYHTQRRQTTQCHDWPWTKKIALDWLGSGWILPPFTRLQCSSGIKILQGTRIALRLSGIRLFTWLVEFWLHVCQHGIFLFIYFQFHCPCNANMIFFISSSVILNIWYSKSCWRMLISKV